MGIFSRRNNDASSQRGGSDNCNNRRDRLNDGQEEYLGQITGVKLVHELMVDIMGGLIPGVLFLFSLIVCVVFPIIRYSGMPTMPGGWGYSQGWFWMVIFLTFLILSYVIGHIFYRSDIKRPDKADLRRQMRKMLKNFRRSVTDGTGGRNHRDEQVVLVARMLRSEIDSLRCALKEAIDTGADLGDSEVYGPGFLKSCTEAIRYLDAVGAKTRNDGRFYNKYVLCVLFPEERDNLVGCPESVCGCNLLPARSKVVLDEYERLLAGMEPGRCTRLIGCRRKPQGSLLLSLSVCYNVLFVQDEVGCSTESRCDFPYISYYKYLLKRRETELLKYVNWNTTNERTKNKLNKYKIRIQMFASNAYSIPNKNESHVRMAASSWYVAKTMQVIAVAMLVVTAIPIGIEVLGAPPLTWEHVGEVLLRFFRPGMAMQNYVIAFCFPLCILIILRKISTKVELFIHYQRLREIYYALLIYHEWKSNLEVVTDREKLLELQLKRQKLDVVRAKRELGLCDDDLV